MVDMTEASGLLKAGRTYSGGWPPDTRLRFVLSSRPEGFEHVVEFVERAARGQRQDG
jgi:hypothetical protein